MPKQRKDSAELRKLRIKERSSLQQKNYGTGEIYLCVLGNGSYSSPRCLYMFSDHTKYLFNCGEGTQRLAHEYKMKMTKLEHVFITHKSWKNLGGLLGLSLTIQDIGVPQITLHGPPSTEDIYSYTKSFVFIKEMVIDRRPQAETSFSDNCMEVQYVAIPSSKNCKEELTYCIDATSNGKEVTHSEKKLKVCRTENSDVCVSYICKCHKKPGQLVMEKCVKLGVPHGPLLGELKSGKDVTLPSGKIVCSKDVVSCEESSPSFIVVECPSKEYLNNFVNEPELQRCFDCTGLVVHFTPSNIMKTEQYRHWMNGFSDATHHYILNEDCPTVNSMAIHRVQHLLNLIHPSIFGLLHETELSHHVPLPTNCHIARTMLKYCLRPHNAVNKNSCIAIEPQSILKEAKSIPGFESSVKNLHDSLKERIQDSSDNKYPEVMFLGTGSCIPSKIRNVSGILLNISDKCSIIMDCGEGSYNQLLKLLGPKNTRSVLVNVACIFISHMHADHHLGLFTLLMKRKAAFDYLNLQHSPALILAPDCIKHWLKNYSENYEPLQFKFIDNSAIQFNNISITPDEQKELMETCPTVEFATVPVRHCSQAYGLVLKSQLKIVYSGDTIPCDLLVEAGKNCSLLIHEATMEDALEEEAKMKMHCTTSQAIDIAQKMNAKYTILTHFSQRYAKIPVFGSHFCCNVGCAFDNMKVNFSDLPIIPLFVPVLETLFAEHVEKLQEKGNKRKLLQESNKSICTTDV